MKNITTIERISYAKKSHAKNSHSKDNSKNNNNCLVVFFGIIHLDDELKSPSSAGQQQIGFLRWVCVLDGFQVDSTKSVTASETTSYRVTGYSGASSSIK